MAEGWARALLPDRIAPYSAGLEQHGMNPHAMAVMQEAGVDIAAQHSKTLDALADVAFDYVVTVCSHADQHCPTFTGGPPVVHVPFDDPPKLAATARSPEEGLDHYRRVRDEIREFVQRLPERLERMTG